MIKLITQNCLNGHLKKNNNNLVLANQFCVLGLFYYKKFGALFSIEGLRFCVVSCVWVIERWSSECMMTITRVIEFSNSLGFLDKQM